MTRFKTPPTSILVVLLEDYSFAPVMCMVLWYLPLYMTFVLFVLWYYHVPFVSTQNYLPDGLLSDHISFRTHISPKSLLRLNPTLHCMFIPSSSLFWPFSDPSLDLSQTYGPTSKLQNTTHDPSVPLFFIIAIPFYYHGWGLSFSVSSF